MPGDKIVVSGNFLIDSESRMKTAAAGLDGATEKDPVCGMSVVEENAESLGNTAEFEGETYYFCMPKCRDSFEKEPEKYIQKAAADHGEQYASIKQQSWLDMLEQGVTSHPPPSMQDDAGTMDMQMQREMHEHSDAVEHGQMEH